MQPTGGQTLGVKRAISDSSNGDKPRKYHRASDSVGHTDITTAAVENTLAISLINSEQPTDNEKADFRLNHLASLSQNVVFTPAVLFVLAQDAAININCQMTDSGLENEKHKVSPGD